MAFARFFSHPDFTVGQGISPYRERACALLFADYTAGMDFHHSLKNFQYKYYALTCFFVFKFPDAYFIVGEFVSCLYLDQLI